MHLSGETAPRGAHLENLVLTHLLTFLDDYPTAPAALLLYDGDEVFWLDRRVLAVPWHRAL